MKGPAMSTTDRRRQRGQIVVLFAIAAFALILMVGLVLDGGSTYGQRRLQQNAADLAALAGANAWLLDTGDATSKAAAATAMAKAVTAQNGYTDALNSMVVTVTPQVYGAAGAQTVKVDVYDRHQNAFAGMIGMPTWDVSVTATAVVGPGGGPHGVAPIAFRNDVFVNGSGEMIPQYSDPAHPFTWGESNGDYPKSAADIAWTVFASPANLDTDSVRGIIDGSDQLSRPVAINQYIGQHNQGNHTAVYGDVDQYLAGQTLTVPIVDNAGKFQGWGMFHVVSASGGSDKDVTGYFTTGFSEDLDVCMTGPCPIAYGGLKVLKLIN
jgi:Flp pilus assembly protein TadG